MIKNRAFLADFGSCLLIKMKFGMEAYTRHATLEVCVAGRPAAVEVTGLVVAADHFHFITFINFSEQ